MISRRCLPAHIVFDLDGTLVDSAASIGEILNTMRSERDLPELPTCSYRKWISLGANQLIQSALQCTDFEVSELLGRFRGLYAQKQEYEDLLYEGVALALEHLKNHKVSLSLCTNKPRSLTEKILRQTKIDKYFPFVCAGGDFPSPKPDPINLYACLEFHGTRPSDTWMVGDSSVDQKTANAAKVGFVFYTAGYDDGVVEREAIEVFDNYVFFKGLSAAA